MRYAATTKKGSGDVDRKKTLSNDLDTLDFTMVDLDETPETMSTTSKHQGIKSKISLLSDLLDHCKALTKDVEADLGGSGNNVKSGYAINNTQQMGSEATSRHKSTAQESTHLKRRSEWQDIQNSSTKRVKLSSKANLVSPASVSTEQIPKTQFRGQVVNLINARSSDQIGSVATAAISSNDNVINPSAPTALDISDTTLPTGEHQLASDEIRAHPIYFELLSSLCGLSQSLSEQRYKLTTYLEKTTVKITKSSKQNQEADKRYRVLKELTNSFLEFETKLSNATLWF